jgi:hypothetical protein
MKTVWEAFIRAINSLAEKTIFVISLMPIPDRNSNGVSGLAVRTGKGNRNPTRH